MEAARLEWNMPFYRLATRDLTPMITGSLPNLP
jgi:hypothetical protein